METIKQKLEDELIARLDTVEIITDRDGKDQNFKEAMEIADRIIEMEKLESDKKEKEKSRIIKYIEVAAVPAGLFLLDCIFKRYYMRQVCNFEKDYTFTTTPGKSIGSIFRFKK